MKRTSKIISILLATLACICVVVALGLLVKYLQDNRHSEDILDDLRTSADAIIQENAATHVPDIIFTSAPATASPQPTQAPTEVPVPTDTPAPTPEPTPAPVANPYQDSFLANSDMAAWLQIPGTVIDYPVMWTPRDENYYLYRSFDKKQNANGCLILDTDSCVEPLTTNLIIHGHNMNSGAMFGDLEKYADADYCQKHSDIILHTKSAQHHYKVIAVFRSQVYKKSDNVFKFYKFFQAETEDEFKDFYDNIKALSLYDTGVTARFGDRFITLSTCAYHVEQGRFVVVAKEVEEGDTYLPIQ